jgi:glycosyltransferase involved in cell wall biosynthesis
MHLSVIIPTYKRAHLLGYVLDGLSRQTCKNFDVIIVLKPSGDKTEKVVEEYGGLLDMDLVLQRRGFVVDALNLGLEHANGDVIAFLDDDAVPCVDWVERHVESYEMFSNIGGVAGNVIPAKLFKGKLKKIADDASHIIPPYRSSTFFERVFGKVWDAPLDGMEDFLVYISKAGVVGYNLDVSRCACSRPVKSLLGMGANMSVLSEAVYGFRFQGSWVLGLAWEQFLGWHLWKKGYNIIFNPKACVYHVVRGETLTRNVKSPEKDLLRWVENYLLFYRLYGLERGLSRMHRIAWLIFSSLIDLKKLCCDRQFQQITRLKGKLYSELIGQKWLLTQKIGANYSQLTDLEREYKRIIF